VRGAGNLVRITAQLIRAADQRHVWSEHTLIRSSRLLTADWQTVTWNRPASR
jgi:TolB-like protein